MASPSRAFRISIEKCSHALNKWREQKSLRDSSGDHPEFTKSSPCCSNFALVLDARDDPDPHMEIAGTAGRGFRRNEIHLGR